MSLRSALWALFLGFAVSVVPAQAADPLPLERVNREVRLELGLSAEKSVSLELYFTHLSENAAYYAGTILETGSQWSNSAIARVSREGKLEVLDIGADTYLAADLRLEGDLLLISPTLRGKAELAYNEGLTLPNGYASYWYPYEAETPESDSLADASLLVTNASKLLAAATGLAATDAITVSGPMDFRPCDGCEHSDQMMLEGGSLTVNVVGLLGSKYYLGDCPGELAGVFEKLIESGVTFTYRGPIHALSPDYWEGNYWMAADDGTLAVGAGTIGIDDFLDAIVSATGTADVDFERTSEDEVSVRYEGGTLRAKLSTGEISGQGR